ncbi:hypothetical protein KPB2_5539 [Klebsiella pneumoniae Kb677]|nr:hypothetical protein KPB2_5539 [Klebsiella pneumoniae Kb677]
MTSIDKKRELSLRRLTSCALDRNNRQDNGLHDQNADHFIRLRRNFRKRRTDDHSTADSTLTDGLLGYDRHRGLNTQVGRDGNRG